MTTTTSSRRPGRNRVWVILASVLVLVSACSSSSTDDAAPSDGSTTTEVGTTSTTSEAPAVVVEPPGDVDEFCELARLNDKNEPGAGFTPAQPEFYAEIVTALNGMIDVAPNDVRAALITIRTAQQTIAEQLEPLGGDPTDPALLELLDSVDTDEMDAAVDTFDNYLADTCGVRVGDPVAPADPAVPPTLADGSGDNSDASAAALFFIQQYGVDAETAACLAEELGDLSSGAEIDPALLTQEICGVAIFDLLASG